MVKSKFIASVFSSFWPLPFGEDPFLAFRREETRLERRAWRVQHPCGQFLREKSNCSGNLHSSEPCRRSRRPPTGHSSFGCGRCAQGTAAGPSPHHQAKATLQSLRPRPAICTVCSFKHGAGTSLRDLLTSEYFRISQPAHNSIIQVGLERRCEALRVLFRCPEDRSALATLHGCREHPR